MLRWPTPVEQQHRDQKQACGAQQEVLLDVVPHSVCCFWYLVHHAAAAAAS